MNLASPVRNATGDRRTASSPLLILLALLGCGDGGNGAVPDPEVSSWVELEAADESIAAPMPGLSTRMERVLIELGPDAEVLLDVVSTESTRSRASRRATLTAIGPRARASLRRHNVRIEQLARYMSGGAR